MAKDGAHIRPATPQDLSALTTLVVSSYRQFPLFNYLYSPLNVDRENATDTLWFWRRRILLEMLDTNSRVVVAEVDQSTLTRASLDQEDIGSHNDTEVEDSDFKASREMLEWTRQKLGGDPQITSSGRVIVGFAIWFVRSPEGGGGASQPAVRRSWRTMFRGEKIACLEYEFKFPLIVATSFLEICSPSFSLD
jgi:hypothetical protein